VTHRDGVEVITGVEVRGDVRDTKVELLGYYVEPTATRLTDVLTTVRSFRRERNREMVDRLRAAAGLDADLESLRAETNGMVGRPHLAQALVDEGIVDSIGAAFDTYLGSDCEAYVEMERLPAGDVIQGIQAAGGVASLAHPGRIRSDSVREIVSDLADEGLDAIEVWYPYEATQTKWHADVGVSTAAEMTEAFDLLQTGGSDCHGPGSSQFRIGDVRVDADALDAVRARAHGRAPIENRT
jgi:hypothetical protein